MTRVAVRRRRLLTALELLLFTVAAVFLGSYCFVYLDRGIYQNYKEWAFDRQLLRKPASVPGFVLHSLRAGAPEERVSADRSASVMHPAPDSRSFSSRALPPGALIGRLEIPDAHVRAMVIHGTEDQYLRRAVGHIEGTALPGEPGNVGLAGHRDTFFRGLAHIRKGDRIWLRTLEGNFEYQVDMLRIVGPADVDVLNASSAPTLTLVTCYPFEYIGSAPRRFIVHARQVSGPAATPSPVPGS